MTEQLKITGLQNLWRDGQEVDQEDLLDEQVYNDQISKSIIQNHFGSGVLLSSYQKNILFDSENLSQEQATLLAANNFDGSSIFPSTQPTDQIYGSQLEIILSNSNAMGRWPVKIAILGLNFQDELILETFYFYHNDRQISNRYYKQILAYYFNDFLGNQRCSRALGGQIVIQETRSYDLSRQSLIIQQTSEPNIFWRDFKLADENKTLSDLLQEGLGPEYSVDSLNINITGPEPLVLPQNDVILTYGQKFLSSVDNLQKITLLLGTSQDESAAEEEQFNWSGNLILALHELQTSVNSPSTIVPELAIEFEPNPIPMAQISFSQSTLREMGYVLNNVLQPVDFVFNTSKISSAGGLKKNKYYLLTIKRSGGAETGAILIGIGNHSVQNSRLTTYNGLWVDSEDYDLWFKIHGNAVKVSSGIAYDHGAIVAIDKTKYNSEFGLETENVFGFQTPISNGQNVINYITLEAKKEQLLPEQNQKTGVPVNSKQKNSPEIIFLSLSQLEKKQLSSEPLLLGSIEDKNSKQNPNLTKVQPFPGLAKDNQFIIISPDADLLSLNLLGSKFYPTPSCCGDGFLIAKAEICFDGYGDVNGDGVIDSEDINLLTTLLGESLFLESTQSKILDGYISTLSLLRGDLNGDGYISSEDIDLLTQYVNKEISSFPIGSSFQHLILTLQSGVGRYDQFYDCDGYVRLDGYLGSNIVDPKNLTSTQLLLTGYSPVQIQEENEYKTIPFLPIEYRINHLPFWQDYLVLVESKTRFVSANFSSLSSTLQNNCSLAEELCTEKYFEKNNLSVGRNDFYLPDSLILDRGEILRTNGEYYKVDLEVNSIVLYLPVTEISSGAINIFEKFVANRGDGLTIANYPAMKYSDCSFVGLNDLALGKVKFGVAISSFTTSPDGYFSDGYDLLIQNYLGLSFSQSTGILTFSSRGLLTDLTIKNLISKIFITIYLKKAGWNNLERQISATELLGLLV